LGDSRCCASALPLAPGLETAAVVPSGPRRSERRIAGARASAAQDRWLPAGIGWSVVVVLALAVGGVAWRALREHADDQRDLAGAHRQPVETSPIRSAEPAPQAAASTRVERSPGEPSAAPAETLAPRGQAAAPAPRRTVGTPGRPPRQAPASGPREAAPRRQESDSDRTSRLLSERAPKVSWRQHSRSAPHQGEELLTRRNGSDLKAMRPTW